MSQHPSAEVKQAWVDSKYLKRWVRKMLNRSDTLECWLTSKKNIHHSYLDNDLDKLQQTRLNWIDWMINELEAGR